MAFYSAATNLVPNDTNGATDVFVRNMETGTVSRASVDSGGAAANGGSNLANMSAVAGWAQMAAAHHTTGVLQSPSHLPLPSPKSIILGVVSLPDG